MPDRVGQHGDRVCELCSDAHDGSAHDGSAHLVGRIEPSRRAPEKAPILFLKIQEYLCQHHCLNITQSTMAALSQDFKTRGRSASVGGDPVDQRMTDPSPGRVFKTPERKKDNKTEPLTPPQIKDAWSLIKRLDDEAYVQQQIKELEVADKQEQKQMQEEREKNRKKRAAAEAAAKAAAPAKTDNKLYSNLLAAKMLKLRF